MPVATRGQFNGYTNHWQDEYWNWLRYGNLYVASQRDIGRSILQNKIDLAEELGIPGLSMAEGFLDRWLKTRVTELEAPDDQAFQKALGRGDVLVWTEPTSRLGRRLLSSRRGAPLVGGSDLGHQRNAAGYHAVRAFWVDEHGKRVFAVVSDCAPCRARLRALLSGLRSVLDRYDLHRGWFGAETMLHSVTCHPGHPLEVIGQGLSQGNDWFTFGGHMDYLMQRELPAWLAKVGLDIPVDVGARRGTNSLGSVAYGLNDYEGLQLQDMPTEQQWIRFVAQRGGYLFRPVYAPACDGLRYDGYVAVEGNKKQIDLENTPFVLQTGLIEDQAPSFMVLFGDKGRRFTREALYGAILERKAVGVLPQGRMMGPAPLRNALQLLLLDRVHLDELFADRIQLEAKMVGYILQVHLANHGDATVSGALEVQPAPELSLESRRVAVSLPPSAERTMSFSVRPSSDAMAKTSPILVQLKWERGRKRTLAMLDLPPALSVHKLLHGHLPEVAYPVAIHNYTGQFEFPVAVSVRRNGAGSSVVYAASRTASVPTGGHAELVFRMPLEAGSYTVKTAALGATNESRLSIGEASDRVTVKSVDLDGDGLAEYQLENAKVRVTLLAIGARVIEYIVKEKNDNVLFKRWPEREATDKRPFRERAFYPYGGFEDFLGQASIETHQVYEAEILKTAGAPPSVRMTADYYGNRLEKTFTLDGESPLLEVRFALEFRNPELGMLGPQPILALGEKHWTEDLFIVPTKSGRREIRMRPEEYFGEILFLTEGWNAAHDDVEDTSFVGAFPVSEPEFLHVWMNHPSNEDSPYYYAELQPWVPIDQHTVRYFSYYLWGAAGPWQKSLDELRRRGLITP